MKYFSTTTKARITRRGAEGNRKMKEEDEETYHFDEIFASLTRDELANSLSSRRHIENSLLFHFVRNGRA